MPSPNVFWPDACAPARSGSARASATAAAGPATSRRCAHRATRWASPPARSNPCGSTASACRAPGSARRCGPGTSPARRTCSAARTRSEGAWRAAASSGARWAIRPPTCASAAGSRRCRACTRPGSTASTMRRGRRCRASARGPRWTAPSPSWRRTCSTSTATCTVAGSRWSSSRACATRRSTPTCRHWSRRWTAPPPMPPTE